MKNLFNAIKKQLSIAPCYLVALLEVEGSTPRKSGTYMLVGQEGLLYGTIGGGGMEYAAQMAAQRALREGKTANFAQSYDLSPKAGMACGGLCHVQSCYLDAGDMQLVDRVLELEDKGEPWWFLVPFGEGKLQATTALPSDVQVDKHVAQVEVDGLRYYAEQYNYDGIVYVFGAGHVSRELVPLLCHLDFKCKVYDDREAFADPSVFPNAMEVRVVDLANLAAAGIGPIRKQDYVAIMTRAHFYDADCERFALQSDADYIGVMGSRSKAAMTFAALRNEGFTDIDLARVKTPIGYDLHSDTPAEIAVAIAAELIELRASRK